jgi:hypothetical protein
MDENVDIVALCNLEGACGIGDNMMLEDMTVGWNQSFEACTSITVDGDFRVEAPASVVFRAAESVVLGDGFVVEAGARFRVEITGDVALREIGVAKTADPASAYEGDPITYTISVENTGNADLTEVSMVDDKCTAAPVFQSGDDGDSVLEPGEVWVYECSGAAEADNFVNTATATFEDTFGEEVSGSGQAAVTVLLAACATDRYVDMGDGTVLDCNTDLLWLQDATCDALGEEYDDLASYADAVAAVAALADGSCGLSDGSTAGDWRLPTMVELCAGWTDPNTGEVCYEASYGYPNTGLIDNDCELPPVVTTDGDCASYSYPDGDPFVGIPGSSYSVWSTTEKDVSNMWSVEMYQGGAYGYSKTASAMVWPVRAR